jgi:5-methylcytosine-specific restriction endonuclease McrA
MSSWGQGDSWANQKARRAVLERDRHTCQLHLIGCTQRGTEAHHLNGLQGRQRSEAANPDEMVAVCRPCHRLVTEQQRMAAWRADQDRRRARRHLPVRPHPGG